MKIENHYISDKAVRFQVSEINLEKMCNIDNNMDYILYNRQMNEESIYTVLGLFYNGKNEFPYVGDGRFFSKDDFFHNKQYAVIGKNIKYTIDNNKKYFNYCNKQFMVLGIIDNEYYSALDNTVYINMDALECSSEFYVDSQNKGNINKYLTEIRSSTNVITLNSIRSFSSLTINTTSKKLFILATLFSQFLLLLITYYYYYKVSFEINVKKLIGFSFHRILINDFKRLFLIILSCVFISYCLYRIIFIYWLQNYHLNLAKHIFLMLFFSIFEIYIVLISMYINNYYGGNKFVSKK